MLQRMEQFQNMPLKIQLVQGQRLVLFVLTHNVSTGKYFSNTNLFDLSILGTSDIFVYRMRHEIM